MTLRRLLLVGLLVYTFTTTLAQTNPSQYGIWERYNSPNNYHTDLAIGNIPGEPTNRVYMCEHPGSPSAGLYKGTISGETITWDAVYGLPNARFFLNEGVMVLYFGVGQLSEAGKYRPGPWTNTCGPLMNQRVAVAYDPSTTLINGNSNTLTIQNINVPLVSLNSLLLNPTCTTSNSVQLPPISGDYYNVRITSSGVGVNGPYTRVYNSILYKSDLTAVCNVFRTTDAGATVALASMDGASMPVISSISPTSGPVGTPVTITGINFSTVPADNTVIFNTTYAVVTASTATTITTTVPAGATTGKITVMVGGVTSSSTNDFSVVSSTLTGFNPTSGITGTPVTITGTNFSTTPANNQVKFGNTPAVVTASTATTISTSVPAGATTGKISVTIGGQTLTSSADFTVNTLTITSFTPASGMVGETVSIHGTNFSATPGNNVVKFNGTTAVVTGSSATNLAVKVPPGATSGTISVTVGAQTATTVQIFKVCPSISLSVSTSDNTSFNMTASGGLAPYTFSYDGTHFLSGTDVRLEPGAPVLWVMDGGGCKASSRVQINGLVPCGINQQAASPAGSTFTKHSLGSGPGLVRVEYDMLTKPDQLDVYYDNELVATTGSAVTSKGFVSFTYNADPAKPKFCVVRITTPDNTNEWNYTALCPAPPAPKVTAFAPGYAKTGTQVSIQGYNFSSGTVVKFGTTVATSPVVNTSGTQITVSVPTGAVTAPITVSNEFGSFTSSTDFIVSPYCLSMPNTEDGSKISAVKFGNINFSSPANGCESYTDNSPQVGYLTAGTTYSLRITLGTCSIASNKAVRAFIDWNGDFDFTDAGETVATSTTSASATREETFSVTVPASLSVTSTRMRIVLSDTSTPTSISDCGNYSSGETEDYTLSFITTGTPQKNASPSSLVEFETVVGVPSIVRSIAISGVNVGTSAFVVTAPAQFQVSNNAVTGFATSVNIAPASGSIGAIVYVRYSPSAAGTHSGNISIANTLLTTPSTVAVTGKSAAPAPVLRINALFDDFYYSASGQTTVQQFTIEGSSLTGTVTVAASANFRFGLTSSAFTQTVTLLHSSGTIAQRVVYVQYQPGSLTAPTSENIIISTPGFTNQNIPVTGKFSPIVTAVSPSNGKAGSTVTITGSNFSTTPAKNVVRFGAIQAVVTASTANSITATVPAVNPGALQVTVGPGATLGTGNFTVISTAPTISLLTPSIGAVGTAVTITGTNFSATPGNNIVKFNNTPAVVTSSASGSIFTTVPPGATTGPVTVTVGTETSAGNAIFTVPTPAPAIAGFSPTSGPAGTSVTITGTNFSTTAANNTVKFNGTVATITGTPTASSIVVTVPTGSTTGRITVEVGGQTAMSSGDFTVTPAGALTITGFSPAGGPIGTAVTITGANFSTTSANNIIQFNGTTATITGTPTTTSIVTSVPSGATTGKITITVGGQVATSSTDFTVTAPGTPTFHTITAFSPATGPAGTTVTITGTGFNPSASGNTVRFNGTIATITGTPTATTIVTTVPALATTGKISVEIGGIVVTSATDYTVAACAKPPKPTITATGLDTASPTLTSSSATGNQWFRNGSPIANATAGSLSVTEAGIYKTQVTVAGGCVSDFSDDFELVVTGVITTPDENPVTSYPNPAEDRLFVETSQGGLKSMRLFHSDGKEIHRLQFETTGAEVDVQNFPAGMYYFTITSMKGTARGKFVKQ